MSTTPTIHADNPTLLSTTSLLENVLWSIPRLGVGTLDTTYCIILPTVQYETAVQLTRDPARGHRGAYSLSSATCTSSEPEIHAHAYPISLLQSYTIIREIGEVGSAGGIPTWKAMHAARRVHTAMAARGPKFL